MSQLKAMVDKLLTNVSNGMQVRGAVAEQLFPKVVSKQYSGLLGKYGKNHLRIENSIKGGRGKYRQVETITSSTQQYLITGHGLEGFVSKEDYANKELPFDAEKDEVMGLQSVLTLEKEKITADAMTNSAIMTQYTAPTTKFDDYANSDPVAVFNTAINTIIDNAGQAPNKAVMDIKVFQALRFHPALLNALGYTFARPGGLKADEIAAILGLEKVFIAEARYNSAKEGQADVLSPVWGKHIVLFNAPDSPAIMQQSLGYQVVPEGSSPRKVYKQDNFNPPGSTAILCEDEYDMLLSDTSCGYLIQNAIA